MKLIRLGNQRRHFGAARLSPSPGFALPDILISMTLFVILMAGLIGSHLFGLKIFELTRVKLGANQDARQSLGGLIEEIRSCKTIRIGMGQDFSFQAIPVNQAQVGNALQIYPTSDTNRYVRYFWNAGDQTLRRMTNQATSATVIAHAITNANIFSAENFMGQVLTNHQNNRVIGLAMNFSQLQYPSVSIGPGQYYDYYQLRTRVTRRALE